MFNSLMFPIYMYLIELHLMELHSMKLCSIKFCLSIRIKPNRNITFFKIPMEINENTVNASYEKYDK